MIKKIFFLASIVTIAISCDKKQAQVAEELKESASVAVDSVKQKADSVIDMHNAKNSMDVIGTYKGTIPCADCEGIQTQLNLGKGNTYNLTIKYLGKGDEKPFESKGKYTWSETKNKIILDTDKTQYKVEEGRLIQLDQEGNIITGELASKYILTKEK